MSGLVLAVVAGPLGCGNGTGPARAPEPGTYDVEIRHGSIPTMLPGSTTFTGQFVLTSASNETIAGRWSLMHEFTPEGAEQPLVRGYYDSDVIRSDHWNGSAYPVRTWAQYYLDIQIGAGARGCTGSGTVQRGPTHWETVPFTTCTIRRVP